MPARVRIGILSGLSDIVETLERGVGIRAEPANGKFLVTQDRSEKVIEVVSDAARHRSDRFELLRLVQ